MGVGGLVAAVAGECVVHVGQGHHLGGDGDVVPLGGDDHHRQLRAPAAEGLQHAEAVQPGHVDVQQEQIHVEAAVEQLQRLDAVLRVEVFVIIPQNVGQKPAVQGESSVIRMVSLAYIKSPLLMAGGAADGRGRGTSCGRRGE